jgi:methyl-accepting chemotaxis protein
VNWNNLRINTLGWILIMMSAMIGAAFIIISIFVATSNTSVRTQWDAFEELRSEKIRALQGLYGVLGYGGMIHRTKNYVLRDRPNDKVRALNDIGAAHFSLSLYSDAGANEVEQAALDDIGGVLDAYGEGLAQAEQLFASGADSIRVDQTVKVDDGPAIRALDTLEEQIGLDRTNQTDTAALTKPQLLNLMRRAAGYDGMIHHFKNLVLRRDLPRRQRVDARIESLNAAIAQYRNLENSVEERQALENISNVINDYGSQLDTVERFIGQGADPNEIDAVVKISDAPALEGFSTLSAEIHKALEKDATAVDEALSSISNLSIFGLSFAVIMVPILVLVTVLLVRRQIIRPLGELTSTMLKLADEDLDVEIARMDQENEIGEMARSVAVFKENAIRRQQAEEQRQQAEAKIAADLETTTRVVAEYSQLVSQVASGDLSQRLTVAEGDDSELSTMGNNLNSMTSDLANIASQIDKSCQDMLGSLTDVTSSTVEQKSAASEQAVAVTQTTTALDEIGTVSQQTMKMAQDLGEMSQRVREEGEQGVEVVKETLVGMDTIRERMESIAQTILALSEQTQQIGDITTVVSNIAQQSKMLALNASIEAAKAGEAGQGFSVVAAEVRDLAEQSQQSTAQVQQILQDIRHATDRAVMATEEGNKGVDNGVTLVHRTDEIVQRLVEVIRETSTATQQIVETVQQESKGIEQVTVAMREINQSTTQFVSTTDQLDEANQRLRGTSETLRDTVSIYRI